MKRRLLLIFLCVWAGTSVLFAQTRVITGTVTSAVEGEGALPGVTVQVKGTTIGAITDLNGRYSVTAPVSATTLVFSYVGMETLEVEIAGRSVVDVKLESTLVGLSEVVVTAFGIKRQARELGVATAQVSEQQLTQAGISNVVNGLTGKVSGLQINTVNNGVNPDTRITLRGNRHFLASNQALIVLDGVPVSATYLNSINPNDIANVNVLKGASASALYGNEASNGVLVITTKRGAGDKPIIRISNTTTFETISYLPKLQERFGAGSGEDTVNYLPEYTFWIGPDRHTDPYTSYENQSWGPEFNGQMVILGGVLADGSYQMIPYSAVPNQKRKFFDTGISLQNDISYSVGDDRNNFYLSLQDVNTTGTIPKDKNRRSGFRVAGARATGIFRADYSLGFSQTNTDESGDEYFQQRPVYWNVLNTPAEIDLTNYKDIVNNKFANHNGYFNGYYPNPYWAIENSRIRNRADNLLGSATIGLNPVEWLDISYRGGLIYSTNNRSYYRDGCVFDPYYTTDPWGAGGQPTGSPYAGVANESLSSSFILTGDLLVQINNRFGDFTSKVILGNSVYSNKYRYVYVGNNSIVIPFLYNVSNRLGEPGVGQTQRNRNAIGVFADITLGYRNFAFIHASARNDWDSRLTEENRSFFYPGVDASIILTDAIPSLKSNFLSFIKIRGGWSQTGQIALDNWYATLPSFSVGAGFPYGSTTGFLLSTTLSNPLLKPEITQEVEAGFEFSFMRDRIHFEVNGYQSNTKDQTIPATISYATGYASAYINAGELLTRGIETDLRLTPLVQLGEFNWNLTVAYAYNTSEVLSIMEGLDELPIEDVSYAVVGEQFPAIKITDLKRDPKGRIIVDAQTGSPIKDSELKLFGHGNPNHILGITSNWNWKGLSLNAVADYRGGHIIVNQVGSDLSFTGTSWFSAQNGRQNFVIPNSVIEVADGVYEENTNIITRTAAQKFWYNGDINQVLSTYTTSAAFWKLREVSLNYSIPVQNIFNGVIKDAQVGIVGRNLLMLRPVTNMWTDPEFNTRGGTSNAVGYTNVYQTPPTRIYGFSVKLTF
ncbi:MAG TPA: SusC/RagA family TonB-linked outer membrane protein [Bacteroidales bacterium]|nr:SusC/RagA family TonB-linked outer membrane protein [Bacteroidales bacterium]